MALQREKQRISSSEVLQALADGEDIRLEGCTISGDLDVKRLFVKDESFDTSRMEVGSRDETSVATFSQSIVFNSCIFEGDICFAGPWDKTDELTVIFKRDIGFNSSCFQGQTRFDGVVFRGLAGFDGCTFQRVVGFRHADFGARALFRTARFDGYGLFSGAVFGKEVRFTNTCFSKGGNFTGVRFGERADFGGCHSGSKAMPIYESVHFVRRRHGDEETFWRFVKQACTEAGYYQLAGESFYHERCANFWRRFKCLDRGDSSPAKRPARLLRAVRLLPEFIFGRLLFGYGERPTRVLVTGVLIIIVCAMFYASPYAEVRYRSDDQCSQLSPMDGLYFSTITFTTLGFGDLYPDQTNLTTRSVAMAEAISGACLMALFVVCLAKRFSRG
ncbi:MAG: potassium channel family protein [Planctomycetes bacterium]|nr:potassium channel family protein [Planctomycetota bacterium]